MKSLLTTTIVLVSLCHALTAQHKLLTLEDIYDPQKAADFSGSPATDQRWNKAGTHYLESRTARGSKEATILRVDARTGEGGRFFDPEKLEAALRALAISSDEARRASRRTSYTFNEEQASMLLNLASDLFIYHLEDQRAARLTHTPQEERIATFSPDGKRVVFVRDNNLFVVDASGAPERALTRDGSSRLLNGILDWVYQEELYGRNNYRAYWWSPDSTHLAFLQLDESPVPDFAVVDHIPYRQDVEVTPYPKAGDPNPNVKLGVVAIAGGAVRWLDLSRYSPADRLIVRVAWTQDSKKVFFQVQNREQTWLDLNVALVNEGKSDTLFRETTRAWVEINGDPKWLGDGSFLWLSERDGWRHLYHYDASGKLQRQVTRGLWEVRSLFGVDDKSGWIYFAATKDSPIATQIYRVRIDGSDLSRLSQAEGTHQANFSPAWTYYIDTWSDATTPRQVRLHGSDGKLVRTIDDNQAAVENLRKYRLGPLEFLRVSTRDGFQMEALLIRPPDFEPSKRYPVWSTTYGGPQAPLVRNSWGGTTYLWHQFLAQKGYLIWICDNRTASGKGAESAWPLYRNFGELELRDLEDGLEWLKNNPWVDGTRIGLGGWSFGGFMTSYALTHSRSFKIGIAGGAVTDWRNYDSIYTERYMQTPQNNPSGYDQSAPTRAAKSLHGKILLVHGVMDDNVHVQNTIQFAHELQKAGRQFELMLYPKSRHGVNDPALVKHMRTLMTDFILKNL